MKLFLALLFMWSFLIASKEFEATYEIYKSGNYIKALEDFKTLANQNSDFEAAYILARMYERGEGCEADSEEALKWYRFSSQGYYDKSKYDTRREVDKEQDKLYKSINMPEDKETADTIKRHALSLYNVKAYKANYFLPISYKDNGRYAPTNGHESKNVETEFQVSLKYDFAPDLLGFNEVYTAAYTQLSFWQFYSESAYFRETNYNPELFVTFPVSHLYKNISLKALRVSLAHQSNGRGGAEERSWNYLHASMFFQYKTLFTELKVWHRFKDSTDYNPELIDYIGYGHIKFILPYKQHAISLLFRNNFDGKSATKINYTYPLFGKDDLFLYVKYFNGYGESLIDYNHNINKIGIGFSISR